jgi:uncharacterized membrane protein YbhN (UPF0104 family)
LSDGQQLFTIPRRFGLAMTAGGGSWIANSAAVVVFATSNLVGVVQITPGNLGVFQVAVALALARTFGIDSTVGLSFALGLQLIDSGIGAALGLVVLSLEGLSLTTLRTSARAATGEFGIESAETHAVGGGKPSP